MGRSHPSRKRRDFSKLNNRYVNKNYLKKWSLVTKDISSNYGVSQTELEFMLFIYDYEFFTVSHVAKVLKRSKKKLYDRTVLPLKREGHIETVYHGKGVDAYVDALFHERGVNNENRLSLSQKGRLLIQRVYRKLEGGDPINS